MTEASGLSPASLVPLALASYQTVPLMLAPRLVMLVLLWALGTELPDPSTTELILALLTAGSQSPITLLVT